MIISESTVNHTFTGFCYSLLH